MYNILLVDDEKYILMGLERGIDWGTLNINNVYAASSVAKAKEIIHSNKINIVLCDIEMPQENGLEFIEYVKGFDESIRCIFLTAYSKFSYAQEAMRLRCMDYIIKPYENQRVLEAVGKAIAEIEKENELANNMESYKKYKFLYERDKKYIVTNIWQGFVTSNGIYDEDSFIAKLRVAGDNISHQTNYLLILFAVDYWYGDITSKTKQILMFGIRNILAEVFEAFVENIVFTDYSYNHVALLHTDDVFDLPKIRQTCAQIIDCINDAIECDISCYIGDVCQLMHIQTTYTTLKGNVQNNLTSTNAIIENNKLILKNHFTTYDFMTWSNLIKQKKQHELDNIINRLFDELASTEVQYSFLNMYVSGFSYMMYQLLNENNVGDIGTEKIGEQLKYGLESKNLIHLQQWTKNIIQTYFEYCDDIQLISMSVEKTLKYIDANFTGKLEREEMAKNVYLNADYLSRIFRKEMGMSISDYIIMLRMDMAKDLLRNTNLSITQISEKCGYSNFSYFAKMFKKSFGLSPIEFRKVNAISE